MTTLTCATGTLAAYQPSEASPWDRKRVLHLYRRMGFGASPQQVETALALSPEKLVDSIVVTALSRSLAEAPHWVTYTESDYTNDTDYHRYATEWAAHWVGDMYRKGFREKMALFWHNHFVTEIDTYICPAWQYQYYKLLEEHALGNFRVLLEEMGKTPAMLVYLNGLQNEKEHPNENYARELYELFTLGRNNGYNEQDVRETARALTGWTKLDEFCEPIQFSKYRHDDGEKMIFGQRGNWGYEDVHNILFEQHSWKIAVFICTKLYQHFISPIVDEDIVAGLATTFKNYNFELVPVLRQLFKSEHFFDEANIGIQVKSPIEYLLMLLTEWNFGEMEEEVENNILYFASALGQELFNPPDVAGWRGNQDWITGEFLPLRWSNANAILDHILQHRPEALIQLARDIAGNDITDPYEVSDALVDYFTANGLYNEANYERAAIAFKGDIPNNYYEDGSWNLQWGTIPTQVVLLLKYLIQQPEFQLT